MQRNGINRKNTFGELIAHYFHPVINQVDKMRICFRKTTINYFVSVIIFFFKLSRILLERTAFLELATLFLAAVLWGKTNVSPLSYSGVLAIFFGFY